MDFNRDVGHRRRLWFSHIESAPQTVGAFSYAAAEGGMAWAVTIAEPGYDTVEAESEGLLGTYGACVGGLGAVLADAGVALPERITKWALHRDVPADRIGPGVPVPITLDGSVSLALRWQMGTISVFASTITEGHLVAFAPTIATIHLVSRPI
ncbi:hypothetical protein [Luteimicrobium sp. DT211]|uniref:hypothetical protein n=1 Tax=Luteimicrobium sp. DT211 TaxID=3393412 RepID=UPI003CE724A2